MDGERDAREALEPYQLRGVRETGTELARGSFAAVVEVDYKGMRCAGKKIHHILAQSSEGDRLVGRFEEECRLLSALRHPHVVQFLGIFFDGETGLPVLVMEFLPVTLAQCLDRYGLLPEEVNYAILRDVALGLRYLHEQRPPVIHRDLSANNVLFTGDMTAKISDLGVAKILRLSPAQMSRMTRAPGTNPYMPPEALRPDPRYDVTIDVFSFGVMMIHILSCQWPLPSEATRVDPHNPTRVIGLSEAERRAKYLDTIGRGHPLMRLIGHCLSNSPNLRPTASDLVECMSEVAAQHPLTFSNKVEMMRRIACDEREKEELQEQLIELERGMLDLKTETERHKATLRLQVADLEAEKTHLITSASAREKVHQAQLNEKDQLLLVEVLEKEQLLNGEKELHQADIEQLQAQLEKKCQLHKAKLEEKDQLYQALFEEKHQLHQLHEAELKEMGKLHKAELEEKDKFHEAELEEKDQLYQALFEEKHQLHQLHEAELKEMGQLHKAELEENDKLHEAELEENGRLLQTELEEKEQLHQALMLSLKASHELEAQQLQSTYSTQLHSMEAHLRAKETQLQAMETQLHAKDAQLHAKEAQLQAKDMELSSQNTLLSHHRSTIEGLMSQARETVANLKSTQVLACHVTIIVTCILLKVFSFHVRSISSLLMLSWYGWSVLQCLWKWHVPRPQLSVARCMLVVGILRVGRKAT